MVIRQFVGLAAVLALAAISTSVSARPIPLEAGRVAVLPQAVEVAFRDGYARCRRQVRRHIGTRIPHKYRFFHIESCVAKGGVW